MIKNFKAINKETNEKVRCAQYDEDRIFVFRKGSSKYGWYYSIESFNLTFEIIKEKSEKEKWEQAYKKIIKLLSESGLWPSIKERCETLLSYGYDVWKQMLELEYQKYYKNEDDFFISKTGKKSYQIENKELKNSLLREFNLSNYGDLIQKYPAYFYSDTYNLHFGSEFEYHIPRFKSMYFGVFNKNIKSQILYALKNHENYSSGRTDKWDKTSYDVSFEYNAEKNMAWYSEEYRNCGNGHYYLALNNSVALFCEND